jgi:glucosylceramidase
MKRFVFRVSVVVGLACGVLSAQGVRWISSTADAPWQTMTAADAGPEDSAGVLTVDTTTALQTMDGFGGCFNELGWDALQTLPADAREKALASLFAPGGANFTMGRAPIGANDFAHDWYSLDETPGDFAMAHFSLERDRHSLIPFMKASMRYQPGLRVWGVPWAPPTWMKTNGAYKGGELKQDPETLQAYALYFAKYVKGYQAEGISMFAVMPQNEPNYNNNVYPQAVVSPALMNIFVRDYMAPEFKSEGIDVPIWLGTIVKPAQEYIASSMDDPKTNKDLAGIALQWEGQKSMGWAQEHYPDKKLMQSETECYNGENSWAEALTTFGRLIDDTMNGASSYFYWNLVLDETGKSHWDWRQNSLITVDRSSHEVRYNPEFYAMKHFSAFVLPGAKRVAVSGGPLAEVVAFREPNGDVVVLMENAGKAAVPVVVAVGERRVKMEVAAESMNTVVVGKG